MNRFLIAFGLLMVVVLVVAEELVQNEPVRQKRFLGHLVEDLFLGGHHHHGGYGYGVPHSGYGGGFGGYPYGGGFGYPGYGYGHGHGYGYGHGHHHHHHGIFGGK